MCPRTHARPRIRDKRPTDDLESRVYARLDGMLMDPDTDTIRSAAADPAPVLLNLPPAGEREDVLAAVLDRRGGPDREHGMGAGASGRAQSAAVLGLGAQRAPDRGRFHRGTALDRGA